MKKTTSIVAILIAVLLLTALTGCQPSVQTIQKTVNTQNGAYAGQTVILHTNDVHGSIEGYSYLPGLKASIEAEGGTVILVDAGDYTNGSLYVSISKGESAVTLMNQVGYDIASLGNHEFDFGLDQLKSNLAKAGFNVLCSNIYQDDNTLFDSEIVYQVGSLKIGFFALSTPETQTKVIPSLITGLDFTEKEELYKIAQEEADKLSKCCDIVICLAHLGVDNANGNSSIDLMANTSGIDFLIDGHSHTVIANGDLSAPIQQTGTAFETIGLIAIDNKTKQIVKTALIKTEGLSKDADVLATVTNIKDTVDAEFNLPIASTDYRLNGDKASVRSSVTNIGNLVTDSMIWSVTNETELQVDRDHIVAVVNSGCIRASIEVGEISRSDIKAVLPFGNTIAVNYIKGSELLEALEASTFDVPNPIGGFPQIAGMKITVDISKAYDAGPEYPASTYCAPNSIQRVTIEDVNGQPFDPEATYAVVTSNFCAAGGDTYYAFKTAYDAGNGFDTSIPMDEVLVNFITYELGGVISENYATPAARIVIK